MAVTHKLALLSADVLALYCQEHFGKNERECHNCEFSLERDGNKFCYLMVYLGFAGERLKDEIKKEVVNRYNELKEREEKSE